MTSCKTSGHRLIIDAVFIDTGDDLQRLSGPMLVVALAILVAPCCTLAILAAPWYKSIAVATLLAETLEKEARPLHLPLVPLSVSCLVGGGDCLKIP